MTSSNTGTLKRKHWIRAARYAIKHDFDTAYGAMRFITRECKDVAHDPHVIRWITENNKRLLHAILSATMKSNQAE